ncbi:TrmB family transcriptional regulator [Nanoarchaeota archaeon]
MKQGLMDFGLSEKEADVYLACLKTGQTTANRISELVDLPRSTTYDVLEKLKKQGLITTVVVKSKIHFVASDPEVLMVSLDEKKKSISTIIPELQEVRNKVGEKPVAEVFQGKLAIIRLLDEILETATSIKIMGNVQNAIERIGYHQPKFRKKRIERDIRVKQLVEPSKESKQIKLGPLTQVRFSREFQRSKEATFILEDRTYHIILGEEISAIRIDSREHAQATEIVFDKLWAQAGK